MAVGYLVEASLAVVAALLCRRASGRASRRGALAWRCVSAGCLAWAGHGVLATARGAAGGGSPWWGAVDDLAAGAFLVLVLAGMCCSSRVPDVRTRLRVFLDACTGATAGGVLFYACALAPSWSAATDPGASLLLRPLAPLLLSVLYVSIMITEIPVDRWAMPAFLSSALGAAAAAEGAHSLRVLGGRAGDGWAGDGWAGDGWAGDGWAVHVLWSLCFALLGTAALVYRGTSVRRSTPSTAWVVALAPVVLVAPAAAVLIARQVSRGRLEAPEAATAAVLVVLVLLRQLITLVENRVLVRRLAQSEAELRHQATHDGLTGLPSRALLVERLDDAARAGAVGVLMIDLDGFKRVNDDLGHHVGDALLVEVAHRLRRTLRHGDTPARLGGDEFAVVVPGAEATAHEVAARVRSAVAAPFVLDDPFLADEVVVDHVGASVGVAWLPADACAPGGGHAHDLLRRADVAMYSAKNSSKNSARNSTGNPAGGGGRCPDQLPSPQGADLSAGSAR